MYIQSSADAINRLFMDEFVCCHPHRLASMVISTSYASVVSFDQHLQYLVYTINKLCHGGLRGQVGRAPSAVFPCRMAVVFTKRLHRHGLIY